ncbi:WxL protein peptidoglycan domain-containing protein [Microbacterium sp. SORGH_AS_0888]|uniref:WxL protein peptidoglycan domain-containing protein n=1 Tax=Microbacterium sp. SORGH_AS_0888 TaxID=3041791 RepID=UPI00278638BE|nr:DUF916 domain-containing protein [Microbacterium sp. SORGH_AS_0888]MDQ1130988.1 hypothetical protein [Microbacterium sp. SORGH_AS_0888]
MNARRPLRSLRPALRRIGVAALAALAALLPALPAAAADGDVTWTVRTASNAFGADRTSFAYTVDPGGSVSDAIVIANHGQQPVDLKVYASDGFTSDEGQLSLRVSGEASQAVGAWIVPDASTVTVPAGQSATVPFTVRIPDNATPGDYAGGVVTSLTVPDAASGVNVDRRLGIRVDLRVGGALAPALAVEDMSVSWNGGLNPFAGGDATVTYTLHNTGNTVLSAQPAARVSGLFGLFGVDAAPGADIPQLLPGESWTTTMTAPGVPPVLALIAATTVTPLVKDAAGSVSPIDVVSGTAVGAAVPWTLLAIIVLLVLAAVLWRSRRRRRQALAAAQVDARVDEAVAKALEERERTTAGSRGD